MCSYLAWLRKTIHLIPSEPEYNEKHAGFDLSHDVLPRKYSLNYLFTRNVNMTYLTAGTPAKLI